jgi:hypothetical protein
LQTIGSTQSASKLQLLLIATATASVEPAAALAATHVQLLLALQLRRQPAAAIVAAQQVRLTSTFSLANHFTIKI